MKAKADDDAIQLFEGEARIASLFLALSTQWRRHAMTGLHLGLDYGVIPTTAAMLGLTITPPDFHDLRAMEVAALGQFAKAAKK